MGNKLVVRNVESLACWAERIAACKNSGKIVSVWCEENGINPKTYYYWHNKLQKAERACSEPVTGTFMTSHRVQTVAEGPQQYTLDCTVRISIPEPMRRQ